MRLSSRIAPSSLPRERSCGTILFALLSQIVNFSILCWGLEREPMAEENIQVLKFGGSSVGHLDGIRNVIEIVHTERRKHKVVTVVSAMGGVTDRLLDLGTDCMHGRKRSLDKGLSEIYRRHIEAFSPLAESSSTREWMRSFLDGQLAEMKAIAQGVLLLREFSDRTRDKLLSYGEILSSNLLARVIGDRSGLRFCHSDAREWIVAHWHRQGSVVDFEETERRIRAHLLPLLRRGFSPVVPGFICRSMDGHAATLGRNGSDYSASIVGAALRAREIVIYTDVDGILTADPNLVAEASVLRQISYQEAAEMSYFGAKVVHPKTMIPAVLKRIPIRIRNTFNAEAAGTLITDKSAQRPNVKTVTSVRDLALLNLEGNGMVGIPGIASRLFDVLARENVNIMMISQSSSEHSVCLIIKDSDADPAMRALRREFRRDIEQNLIEDVKLMRKIAIVSIIGAGMRGRPGISGKFFDALGKSRINVLAIAQGSSELNISAAIQEKEHRHAVQSIHSAFGLTRDLNLFVFGCGNIGRTLLKQIHENGRSIARRLEVNLNVLGVANSKYWYFSPVGISTSSLRCLGGGTPLAQLDGAEERPEAGRILEHIAGTYKSDVVIVDATAADLADIHIESLKKGFHVVTANKRPLSTSLADYQTIQTLRRRKGLSYQYEATFGAGLPLLSTLQDLIHTGDRILSIQGCLSGTLGFVCSRIDERIPFSEALAEAMARGYTEPDPRDDLSGIDVARKSLIIARELGAPLEMEDVRLKAMIPRRFFGGISKSRFLASLPSFDRVICDESEGARQRGQVLRFLADIDKDGCRVGLTRVARDSPIGGLAGPDNILVFKTVRYNENPLVIQGPGAGASVTAAGVLGDLLKIAKWI